jgi:hypothetical protein
VSRAALVKGILQILGVAGVHTGTYTVCNLCFAPLGSSKNYNMDTLIINLEKYLINWLKESGLKVNENKTEICVFHRSAPPIVQVKSWECNNQK